MNNTWVSNSCFLNLDVFENIQTIDNGLENAALVVLFETVTNFNEAGVTENTAGIKNLGENEGVLRRADDDIVLEAVGGEAARTVVAVFALPLARASIGSELVLVDRFEDVGAAAEAIFTASTLQIERHLR